MSFCPNGTTLASGSHDTTVRLWDVATGRQIGEPLRGHESDVNSVSFSPDGTTLASASDDGTIRLWHAVPLRDRIDEIRERRSQMNEVRTMLADRIARVGPTESDVHAFAEEVRADPRFAGELRTAALLVVGEVDQRRSEFADAIAIANRSWKRALGVLATGSIDQIQSDGLPASTLNSVARYGLTELRADAPERDLLRLLAYAERAVELTERENGYVLDTLARAYWELGDKPKAIAIQQEAIDACVARMSAEDDTNADDLLPALLTTLARYEAESPPSAPDTTPAD